MECEFTGERVYPGMTRPRDMIRIWRGETKIPPQVTLRLWQEHRSRYEFAMPYCKDKKVLDVACGTAYGSGILKASDYTGVDIDLPTLRKAHEAYKNNGAFIVADALSLPFKSDSFNVIVSFETIEHIPKELLPAFLTNVTDLLADGGIFIVSTPNRNITNPGKNIEDQPKNHFHKLELIPEELEEILEPHFGKAFLFGQGNKPKDQTNGRTILRRAKTLKKLALGELAKVEQLSVNNREANPTYIIAVCEQPQRRVG